MGTMLLYESLCKSTLSFNTILQALVYVSTAYSNCTRNYIEEIVYPPPASIESIDYLMTMDIDDNTTTNILGNF